jgi:hypothetical protein
MQRTMKRATATQRARFERLIIPAAPYARSAAKEEHDDRLFDLPPPAVPEHRSSAGSTIPAGDIGGLTMSFTDWTSAYLIGRRPRMAANVVSTSQPLGVQAGLAHAPRC